jgi:hypothetical protein
MTWLNRDQFKELADTANTIPPGETESGFSAKAQQGPNGEVVLARDRLMVGGVPGSVAESLPAPISGRQTAAFARKNKSQLAGPEMYMGAWHESERQPRAEVDLDVSEGFPRTPAGTTAARSATVARNERAYGEVDENAGYAGTHDNPLSTQRLGDKHGIEEYLNTLRLHPDVYEKVVSGDVLGGVNSWIKRSPVRRS